MKIKITGDANGLTLLIAALTVAQLAVEGQEAPFSIENIPYKELMAPVWGELARDLLKISEVDPGLTQKTEDLQ